ncbi:MAG: hypothetical protein KDC95_13080 [Planctomycetes bacterium]|nr:hypothetical protein [Planctomycetota bacterium]
MTGSPRGAESLAAFGCFVVLGTVAVVTAALFDGGAVFKADDYPTIAYAASLQNVLHDFVGPQYDLQFFAFWRPVITASLAIDEALFGVEPAGFLVMNCLAFASSVFLLWMLLRMLVPDPRWFAWIVAGSWLVHPAPVVSLDWVVGRVDTHSVLLMLAACVLHVRHRRGGKRYPVMLMIGLALAAKESAIGLPFLLLGLDFLDPHPTLVRGPVVLGRAMPALIYVALLPLYFVFRYLVLGVVLGGYGFHAMQSFDALAVVDGLRQTLGLSLLPGAPKLPRDLVVIALVLFAMWWALFSSRERRAMRSFGVLAISAGMFAPLAQLLPSMRDIGQQRYAFFACTWSLVAWAGAWLYASRGLGRASKRVAPLLAALPALLLVPARVAEMHKLESHDRFVREVSKAVDDVAAHLPGNATDIVVLGGDAEKANHPQRLLWGLGAMHAPPFRDRRVDVVTLRKLVPFATAVEPDLAAAGLGSYVAVEPDGRVQTRNALPIERRAAKARGFEGTLDAPDYDRLLKGDEAVGFSCAADVDRVAVLTSVGSAMLKIAPKDGVLWVRDLLVADLGHGTAGSGGMTPLVYLLVNALDLAPHSPVDIVWREGETVRVGRLRTTRAFTERLIRELRVSLQRAE